MTANKKVILFAVPGAFTPWVALMLMALMMSLKSIHVVAAPRPIYRRTSKRKKLWNHRALMKSFASGEENLLPCLSHIKAYLIISVSMILSSWAPGELNSKPRERFACSLIQVPHLPKLSTCRWSCLLWVIILGFSLIPATQSFPNHFQVEPEASATRWSSRTESSSLWTSSLMAPAWAAALLIALKFKTQLLSKSSFGQAVN